jgi:predicted transcriptional regulator of viral defense system
MKFDAFYEMFRDEAVLEIEAIRLAWKGKKSGVPVMLHRWEKEDKILKLKNGLYVFSKKYRKKEIFEPFIAYLIKNPSYISLEKAMEYYQLIPDAIFTFTSVTPRKRPALFETKVGNFKYVSIKKEFFWGYTVIESNDLRGYIAEPEKALLDTFYYSKGEIDMNYLKEMRFQNLEILDRTKLLAYAERFDKSRIYRAVNAFSRLLEIESYHER